MFDTVKNWIRVSLIIAALPLVAACAGGPTYSALHASEPALASDSGRIYFYREGGMLGAAIQPAVDVNGTKVGEAVPGGYFYIDRPAGTYKVSTTTEKEEDLNVTLAAGQVVFVKLDISMGVLAGHVIPTQVDPAQGAKEIADCSFTADSKKP